MWPGAALADAPGHASADLLIGLTAGIALACAVASAIAWLYTRAAIYGAGLAFALVEGILRTQPTLFPAGALQAGSYAALLAMSVSLIAAGQPGAARLVTACRWTCIGLTGLAALALIFVYDSDDGMMPTLIAGAGAAASVVLAAWFLAVAARPCPRRAATLALGAVHLSSAWILAHDAWSGSTDGGPVMPLARLLLALAALLLAGLERRTQADPARQQTDDAQQLVQGELRLVEMTGALDAQRQMNALISHELRAPLATISAAAQSLDMILSGSGEAVDNRLARIHRSVTRMTELMEQLLNQDRLGEQAWTPRGEQTDMSELAGDVVAAMQPDTAHALRLQAGGAPLPVYCDRALTSVVVRNLIHNAIKYSPASEPIRIETGETEAQGVPMAWVAVTDRGPGIGVEEQARIFEPRFRRAAHRETQGMGIGLYLARRICQSQGGSLVMHSEVGVGTRFVITLPARPPEPDAQAQAANT
ncbi:Adaptive-response sensory-kinase SasA [Achromobacter dolens]|uniref:histidine kinase n=1 Tax=Achromobacter dolens TaxID=1287738 RepID=A0A6S7D7B3_9BURK|nr:Adaptive-response sensory-kinase SasA [Achromobacter dolens]CAB3881686.1 Adaptive-response sensory-kinase SasA [Achromobacter dolens]